MYLTNTNADTIAHTHTPIHLLMHLDCHASPSESIGFIPENLQPWPLTLQFKAFATSSTLALEQMTQAERDTL